MKKEVKEILEKDKINYLGRGSVRDIFYYEVCGLPVSVEVKEELHPILNESVFEEEYDCSCLDCSVKMIPNNLPPRCVFSEALQIYRKKYGREKNKKKVF